MLSFYFVAGPAAIAPHFERYAICLIAPTVLITSRALVWWMQPTSRFSYATAPLLLAAAWSLLIAFQIEYVAEFNRTGGQSHLTFRTADIEPKHAAFDLAIESHFARKSHLESASHDHDRQLQGGPLQIVTSEWWLYWPLRYLASRNPDVFVERCGLNKESTTPQQHDELFKANVVLIEFAGSDAAWRIDQAIAERRRGGESLRISKQIVRDASGRVLIAVYVNDAK